MKNFLILVVLLFSFLLSSATWYVARPRVEHYYDPTSITACDDSTYIAVYRLTDTDNYVQGKVIFKTTDYGETWDSIYSNVKPFKDMWNVNSAFQFQFFGKDTIYGYNRLEDELICFYKTLDGGINWDTTLIEHIFYARARMTMYFKNPLEGLIYMNADSLVKTTDGGETWFAATLPSFIFKEDFPGYYHVRDISCIGDTLLFSAYSKAASNPPWNWKQLFFSTDYGENWEFISEPYDSASYRSLFCELRNSYEWWVYGMDSWRDPNRTVLKRTTDRGESWEYIDSGGRKFFGMGLKIQFFGSDTIRFCTTSHSYYSTDNGKTWHDETGIPEMPVYFYHVAFSSFDRGMICEMTNSEIWRLGADPTSVGSEGIRQLSDMHLYPNPTAEVIYLDNIEVGDYEYYEIISLAGNKVQEGGLSGNSVRVDHLPAGVYHLMLLDENNPPQVKKFIKK